MNRRDMSAELYLEGSVLDMDARLALGYRDGGLLACGRLRTEGIRPEELAARIGNGVDGQWESCLAKMTDKLPDEISFQYENGRCLAWVRTEYSRFGIFWAGQSVACMAAVRLEDEGTPGTLESYLRLAAGMFGIRQLYFWVRKGEGAPFPILTGAVLGTAEECRCPAAMQSCDILFCGKFSYHKEKDLVGKFLHSCFGMEKAELFLFMGMRDGSFSGYALLPALEGSVMSAEELFLGVECGKTARMMLMGTFRFSFVPDALFRVKGAVGGDGFLLEASACLKEPVTIYKRFKIGDTALALQVGTKGTAFRLYANLYIGEIKTFGAVGVAALPGGVNLEFLSVAVTDITLPKLIKNIFGSGVTFADGLDFLALSGLPLALASDGRIEIGDQEDVKDAGVRSRVAGQFNRLVSSPAFTVGEDRMHVERISGVTGEGGVALTDKSRMRHYYVDRRGRLSLQAQFYYSTVDVSFGDYTLKRGVFLCGSITLFQKFTVRALFSMSETDGILAYASVDRIDLGIVSLGPSGIATEDNPLNYFPKDSLLWLLMDRTPGSGAVFFLRAGKNECSFYLDGKIILFGFWGFAARILYVDKRISVDVRLSLGGLISLAFRLSASYADFSSMNFSVALVIDCTGLEKMLRKAQDSINRAIERLREKIGKAKKQIDQAQRSVNELHSQIRTLDERIESCRRAIKNAKWWKKAFVAIAKGIEIAAYEVAKVGLYAAIGVANAALEVAKLAVSLGGIVGEGVLRAVNAAISATLNLFFVKYIRLEAAASAAEQSFEAEIEFVALGKTFHLSKRIGASNFLNHPDSALDDQISGRLEPELAGIEEGTFKSNRRRYKKMQCTMKEYRKMLGQGMNQLDSGTALLTGMADLYLGQCREMLPEYERYNHSYVHALGEAEAVLDMAGASVNFEQMNQAVSAVKKAMNDPEAKIGDEKRERLEPALREYEAAARLAGRMSKDAEAIRFSKQELAGHLERVKETERLNLDASAKTASVSEENMEKVLNGTEELLYENFSPTRGRGIYINLSREERIRESFDEMREKMGLRESEAVSRARSRRTPVKYEQRL